jgi:hypothetical protein
MKLTVFTAVIGPDTDPLYPVYPEGSVQYLCFTDQHVTAPGWEIRQLPMQSVLNAVAKARELKIRAHETLAAEDPDVSLWVDAAYELRVDPRGVADQWLWRTDAAAFPHPDRSTMEAEGTALVRLGKVERHLITAQVDRYHATRLRQQNRLTSTGYLLRRHCGRVRDFNAIWWDLFRQGGHTRDQMTVDWAAAASGTDIRHLAGHYRDNAYARWHKHTPEKKR